MDLEQRIAQLKARAMHDPGYAALHEEALVLEAEFEQALADLPDEVQDTVWRYLFHCEAQSQRLLELAVDKK